MDMRQSLSNIAFPLWNDPIDPISLFRKHLVDTYMWKPKGDGNTTIDINITLSGPNTQTSTSVSFSAELPTESVKEVQQLTEMYVKAVEAVFGKDSPGNTQTKE